jgi:hypothetical protein
MCTQPSQRKSLLQLQEYLIVNNVNNYFPPHCQHSEIVVNISVTEKSNTIEFVNLKTIA